MLTSVAPISASAATPLDAVSIAGIWHQDIHKFMAQASVYFVIDPGNRCKQVARIQMLGVTKWTVRICSWSLKGNLLSLSLLKSATPEEEQQKAMQITVADLSTDSLVVSSDGEVQRWTREAALPEEFQARLQAVLSQSERRDR